MATFVLVPGAFHGGWCWKKVVPLLQASGHDVYTPTLTGLGERSHLLSREVNLETHIKDVVNLLEFEDLTDIILVGHSYGAGVSQGVVETVPARVGHLVSLDGNILLDGQSLLDSIETDDPKWVAALREIVRNEGHGWKIPFSDSVRPLMENTWREETFGVTNKDDLIWLRKKLTPHPVSTFEDKLHLHNVDAALIPKTLVWCSIFEGRKRSERPRVTNDWKVVEIETGHDAMITAPNELSRILLTLAEEKSTF